MPKHGLKLIGINLNLLKPQSNPEKILVKLTHWLLSSGRYIFVVVHGLVLLTFIARFKLDADLDSNKVAIEEQIPYIESLKPYEILIRETQLKLSAIEDFKKNSPDWSAIFKKISDQTPLSVKIISINIKNNGGAATINMTGQTQSAGDLTSFITGLKEDSTFSDVNLASIGLEQGSVKFTINASAKLTGSGGKQS